MATTNSKSGSSRRPRAAEARLSKRSRAKSGFAAVRATVAFTADVEVALAELEKRRLEVIGPVEQALVGRLRSAVAELRACVERVAEDGLLIAGSMGQQRPHPLLKLVSDLRREVAGGLKELDSDLEAAANLEQANRLSRGRGRMRTEEAAALVVDLIASRDADPGAGAEKGVSTSASADADS